MESSLLTPVAPVRPAAAYVGGKRNLAGRLVSLIETVPHTLYAEPFVGMGGVFLRLRSRPRAEVINDLSREVSNFFRVLQVHYVAFLDMLRFQITTRAEFERLSAVDPETLTDLQRAARFLYLQRTAFGGKVVGRNFGVSVGRSGTFDVTKLGPLLEELHERLAGVIIERLPFDAFIHRYDAPGTLFYLDPPYWGAEDYYGEKLFSRADFIRLRDALISTKGCWILSINDVPLIRELFAGCRIDGAEINYGLAANGSTPARELIIQHPG